MLSHRFLASKIIDLIAKKETQIWGNILKLLANSIKLLISNIYRISGNNYKTLIIQYYCSDMFSIGSKGYFKNIKYKFVVILGKVKMRDPNSPSKKTNNGKGAHEGS